MSDKKNRHIGYTVSLCGIMSGLALALMFILGMIPSFEYITPAIAGILIWVIRDRLGVKYGLVSYIAVGLLCLLITPNYEVALMYIFLLGYYPIVREYLQKIRLKVLRWAAKLVLFSVTAVSAYMILIYLFGMTYLMDETNEFGQYGSLIIYCMGAFAFVMYDIFLGMYAPFYEKMVKPKIQRRMR